MKKNHAIKTTDRTMLWIVGIALVAIVGLTIFLLVTKPKTDSAIGLLGQQFEDQGRTHIAPGTSHPAYNSNPPTSGWHYAQPAPWGVKTEELSDETLVHNLEHGGIWISYQPDKLSADDKAKLENITNTHTKTILTPRAKNESLIAVASWTRLLKLDSLDENQINDFIKRNANHAPEQVP